MSTSPFLNKHTPLLVGVDVGGSKIEAIVIDKAWQEQGRATGPTKVHTPDHLLTAITTVVTDALLAAESSIEQVSALGVCVPGRVNQQTGEVANAVNLNLRSPFPLAEELTRHLGRPVYLENDGRSAALGAYRLMNMKTPIKHMAYVNVGTGYPPVWCSMASCTGGQTAWPAK
jgi:glucokinase